jgi:hypothetical protein
MARIMVDLINSHLPQYIFENINAFPSMVADKIKVNDAGSRKILKSLK